MARFICSLLRLHSLLFSLAVSSLFFSALSYSADYSWVISSNPAFGSFPSPSVACQTYTASTSFSYFGIARVSDTSFNCQRFNQSHTGPIAFSTAVRTGAGCTPPSVYNSLTFSCDAPPPDPCLPTVGLTIGSRVPMGVISSDSSSISHNDPPGAVCQNSCQYAWSGGPASNIYRFVEGLDNTVYGDYLYQGNGVSCSASNDPIPPQTVIQTKDSTRDKTSGCAAVVVDPQGGGTSQLCTTTDEFVEPGSLSCGQINDKWICTSNKPTPQAAKKTVTTETTTTTSPDGSTAKNDVRVTVVESCTSIKGCETSTTTSTTSTGTDSAGADTPGSSSCTGANCSGSGAASDELPAEALEPTCDPATDSAGCSDSSVSGDMSCDVEVVCSGDAIQCAILRQSKTDRCNAEDNSDYQNHSPEIDGLFSGPEFDPPEDDNFIDLSAIFSAGTRWLPSSCPADIPLNLSSVSRTVTFSFSSLCTLAEYAGYLFASLAALFFVRFVGGAL
jgi:hypothetical protein